MHFIGITGGTGSGKTTLTQKIAKKFCKQAVKIISQDSYYRDTSSLSSKERAALNFDHPDAIDFELLFEHLCALKNGKNIAQPIYSFKDHNRTREKKIVTPGSVVLLEGILILTHTGIRDLLDLKIYVEVDDDERLIRRLHRDILERGRHMEEVLAWYRSRLKPMHKEFVAPTKGFADLVIPNNTTNIGAQKVLETIIHRTLTKN